MNAPEHIADKATERARTLLKGRLERGGIDATHPEWYFQVEAALPQAYLPPAPGHAAGWQVRVHTWRHWSDARVHLDADTGEVMYRCVDRLASPPTDAELDEDEAVRVASGLVTIPPDARLRSFWHEFLAAEHKVARIEWEHFYKDLRVDGDYLWVMLHPVTHKLVAFGKKWRKVEGGK